MVLQGFFCSSRVFILQELFFRGFHSISGSLSSWGSPLKRWIIQGSSLGDQNCFFVFLLHKLHIFIKTKKLKQVKKTNKH